MPLPSEIVFTVGDHVTKTSGDYRFDGVVVAAFVKLDGRSWRYVVENRDGVLHIFSGKQLAAAGLNETAGGISSAQNSPL
jgi:hypothetical protein